MEFMLTHWLRRLLKLWNVCGKCTEPISEDGQAKMQELLKKHNQVHPCCDTIRREVIMHKTYFFLAKIGSNRRGGGLLLSLNLDNLSKRQND